MIKNNSFRPIEKNDNREIAKIIRLSLEDLNMAIDGTVYTDPTTDHLYELFQTPQAKYWIAEHDNKVIGGCGIFPTKNLPHGYAELVKLYVKKEFRGQGIGEALMNKSIQSAKEMGFTHLYLESFPSFKSAIRLYNSLGFIKQENALGESGHFACNYFMTLAIT
jgi:putative acetyltransferase